MIYTNATQIPREELNDVIVEGYEDSEQYLGLKIFPEFASTQTTVHAPKIKLGTGNLMRATRKRRTPGANFDRWQSGIEDYTASLLQVGEEALIPDETSLAYEDYWDVESFYTMEAGGRLFRGHEIEVAAALINTSNFDEVNGAVAYSNANLATMTPVTDFLTAIRRVKARGERANSIVMSGVIYDRVRQSADMRAFIAGSINPGAAVTQDTIQAAFAKQGISQVLIGDDYVNNSQDGKTNSIDPIWPVTDIFIGKLQGGALRTGGIGRTFYWEKEGPVFNVTSYRDEPRKSNVIRAMKTTLVAVTNERAGTLIGTQVTT